MSAYPPPQPGHGPPPPGYGPQQRPPGPAQRPPPRPPQGPPSPQAGQRPPSRGSANGFLAAVVAGAVIVVGIVTTVLLVTSDANTAVRAGTGSGSAGPSGSRRPGPSGRPTGPTVPAANLAAATSAGSAYFGFLDAQLYFASRGKWCNAAAFPLAQDEVYSVDSAYALGSARGSASLASMQGHVSFDDGRSGSVTIYLRPVDSTGASWCITSQSGLS